MKKLLSMIVLVGMMVLPMTANALQCTLPLLLSTPVEVNEVYTPPLSFNNTDYYDGDNLIPGDEFGGFMGVFQIPNQGDDTIINFLSTELDIDITGCELYSKIDTGSTNGITSIVGYIDGDPVSDPYSSYYGTWDLVDGYQSQYTIVKTSNYFTVWDYGEFVEGGWWTTYGCGDGNYEISHFVSLSTNCEPVPEPATMLLFGTGLAGMAGFMRKRKII